MASRVNVKFVVLLSTVLVLVAGGAGALAFMVLLKSAEDLVARGDAMMAEGDFKAAEVFYSKAVDREPYNAEFLTKWRSALHRWVPETDREFQTEFRGTYIPVHRQLALSDSMANVQYQVEYANLLATSLGLGGFDRASYDGLAGECDRYISVHQTSRPTDPSWIPLRRMRGLARARIAIERLELTPELQEQTLGDLEAALQHDPADYEVLESIVILKDRATARAREMGRNTEAAMLKEQADGMIRAFVERNGAQSVPGAQAAMLEVQSALSREAEDARARLGSAALPELQKIAAKHAQAARAIAEVFVTADPELMDARVVRRVVALESQVDPAGGLDVSMRVVEHALSGRPDNPEILLIKGELLAATKQYDAALTLLEGLVGAPPQPLGLPGLVLIRAKTLAAVNQARFAVQAAGEAEDEAQKSAWIARARQARENVIRVLSDTSPVVQLVDAKIAMLQEDRFAAQALLDKYNQATGRTDLEGLWLSADVALKLNQSGNTKIALERIIELDPSSANAHLAMADVELGLNRPEAARDHLLAASKSRPDDPALYEKLVAIEKQLGMREAESPAEQVILEARRLERGSETTIADVAAAIDHLRKYIAGGKADARVYSELIRLQVLHGSIDTAIVDTDEAVRLFPEDERLKSLQAALASSSSVDDFVIHIDQDAERSEVEKALTIYGAYQKAGRPEDADRALDRAARAEPNHPTVLELLFRRAAVARDIDEAKRIADRAASANADRIEGLSFRARVLMLEGKDNDALAAMNQAVQQSPNNASLWRTRANLEMEIGRPTDAVQSFQKALAIRENDMDTIMAFCQSLVSLNRLNEALELARRSETHGRADPVFMEMLLNLEAAVGNRFGARDRRERILQVRPDDIRNRIALADLYVSLGQWDQARTMIDETRSKAGQTDALVQLEARWHAERNDLESARRVYAVAIANTPPQERIPKFAALADFLIGRGRTGQALVALEQASRLQAPGEHPVDARLGDTLMLYGRDGDAARYYRRILEDGDAPDFRYTKRLAEALIRLDRLTEAEQLLSTIPNADSDVTVVLLRAQAVLNRGDDRRAREMLDAAVDKWPDDFRVWLKRADAEAANDDLLNDALYDVERAIELRPEMPDAHHRRAELLTRLGRHEEAIEELRQTVRLNPTADELRAALLVTLITRDMVTEAVQMAGEWFDLHPRDVGLRSRVAEMFVTGGKQQQAIHIYQDAFVIEQQPQIVLRLADLLLGAEPPKLAEAERILNEAKAIVAGNPALLLARARVYAQTNRGEAARQDCLTSFKLSSKEADPMTYWYATLARVFGDSETLLSFLRELAAQPGGADWAGLFTGRVLLEQTDAKIQGLEQIKNVSQATRDPQVRYSAYRALAGNRYNEGDYQSALNLWNEALKLRPGDWQLENNIAYALASDLGKPAEALPYAEAAAEHGPDNPETHDTLATVYLALGRPADAIGPMEAAVRAARTSARGVNYMVRLAQARLESGDKQGAADLVSEVQALLDKGRELDDQYRAIFDRVREGVGQ